MSLKRTDFANIGETLYTGTLENGLRIVVVPRPGFMKKYAFFAANYGGAVRNFSVDGRRVETPEGVAHFLEHKMFDMPWGNALGVLCRERRAAQRLHLGLHNRLPLRVHRRL